MDPTENEETVSDDTEVAEGGQPEGEETPDADLTPNERPEPRKTRKERRAEFAASFKEQLRERDTALATERGTATPTCEFEILVRAAMPIPASTSETPPAAI